MFLTGKRVNTQIYEIKLSKPTGNQNNNNNNGNNAADYGRITSKMVL